MSLRVVILFILLFGWPSQKTWASDLYELHEVRLAQVELAITDGETRKAMALLQENLTSKYFHLNSFLFIAEYFRERGRPRDALKFYYYAIKKVHGEYLLRYRDGPQLFDYLESIPKPTEEAQTLYFTLAGYFWDLFVKSAPEVPERSNYLSYARKYFRVCKFYEIHPSVVDYNLGLIEKEFKMHDAAIEYLISAEQAYSHDSLEVAENIKYLIGDSFFHLGKFDTGLFFLKSAALSPNSNQALRDYAEVYLNALKREDWSLAGSFGVNYNDNLHSLSDRDLDLWQSPEYAKTFEENLYTTGGFSNQKALSYYFVHQDYRHWSYYLNAGILEELLQERRLSTYDSRTMSGGGEITYHNMLRSRIALAFAYSELHHPIITGASFSKYSSTNQVVPRVMHFFSSGIFQASIPISKTNVRGYDAVMNQGISLSFSPFTTSKYFNPTASLGATLASNVGDVAPSSQGTISFSNQSIWSSRLSTFVYGTFLKSVNKDRTYSYNYFSLNITANYVFPKWQRWSSQLSTLSEQTARDDGHKINKNKITLSLTFSI